MLASLLTILSALLLVGCNTPTEQLTRIENKIDELAKKVEEIGKAAPRKPSRPKGPDPSKVYSVAALGQQKGPSDAFVTIVESSDFQ